jgi:hypothetical protein
MPVETSQDNEAGYRKSIYANLGVYLVNALSRLEARRADLHRATCDWITPTRQQVWRGAYIKSMNTRLAAWMVVSAVGPKRNARGCG